MRMRSHQSSDQLAFYLNNLRPHTHTHTQIKVGKLLLWRGKRQFGSFRTVADSLPCAQHHQNSYSASSKFTHPINKHSERLLTSAGDRCLSSSETLFFISIFFCPCLWFGFVCCRKTKEYVVSAWSGLLYQHAEPQWSDRRCYRGISSKDFQSKTLSGSAFHPNDVTPSSE